MGKVPWLKFYPGDWITDPCLSLCTPSTRGIWMDILCAIHQLDRKGEMQGSIEQLARITRCQAQEIAPALLELQSTGTAEIFECPQSSSKNLRVVRIVSRRMLREYKQREKWKLQKQDQRGPKNVLNLSGQSPPVDVRCQMSDIPLNPLVDTGNGNEKLSPKNMFLILWETYPAHRRGIRQHECQSEFAKLNPNKELFGKIISALDELKQSDEWNRESGRYVPGLKGWISSGGWEAVKTEAESKCSTCKRIGVIVRKGDKILPWSLEREVKQELKPEVCPECKGRNRLNTPGLPDVKF